MNDEIDELRKIIQEAWNAGDRQVKDTFGTFLDRAAAEIYSRGYRKNQPIIRKRAEFKTAYGDELEGK